MKSHSKIAAANRQLCSWRLHAQTKAPGYVVSRDQSVIVQARKILTQHIYGMVDQGVQDEQRLTVGGLAHLKAKERDHGMRSAHGAEKATSSA